MKTEFDEEERAFVVQGRGFRTTQILNRDSKILQDQLEICFVLNLDTPIFEFPPKRLIDQT